MYQHIVHAAHCQIYIGSVDDDTDLDLAGGDHLDVDVGLIHSLEHHGCDTGGGHHAGAYDADLADIGVNVDMVKADLIAVLLQNCNSGILILGCHGEADLETVAEMCGFNSQVTYCNVFKKIIGMTTNQWLKLFKDK